MTLTWEPAPAAPGETAYVADTYDRVYKVTGLAIGEWIVTATYKVPDPAKPPLRLGRAIWAATMAEAQNLAELDAALDIELTEVADAGDDDEPKPL
jgi:hypothetical protein